MKDFSKVLFLEMRGCNFTEGSKESQMSDIGNYRVGSYNNSIISKDGTRYIIDLDAGTATHTESTTREQAHR